MLTGTNTGAANAFTITNALTGGAGVTFAGNAVAAADASPFGQRHPQSRVRATR